MNTKIIISTGRLIAVSLGLTLALPAFGSDIDQNEKAEDIRKCTPKMIEAKIEPDNDTSEMSLLEAIERAGGFNRLKRKPLKLDERPAPSRFNTDGSTMLATSFGCQPNSANKTRERTA